MKKYGLIAMAPLLIAAAPGASDPPKPGEGVLCLWAFTAVAAEAGHRCRAGQNPQFQAELDRFVKRIDEYVMRNTGMPPARIAEFKRQQAQSAELEAPFCEGVAPKLFDKLAADGAERLRPQVDRLLARPGHPAWGDCI